MLSFKTVIKLFYYVKKNRAWLLLTILSLIIISLVNIFIAQLSRQITDAAMRRDWKIFIRGLYSLVIIILSGSLFKFIEKYSTGKFSSENMMVLRDTFLNRVLKIKIDTLESNHSGNILSIFSSDMNNIQLFFQSHLIKLIYQPVFIIISFTYLFIVNSKITLAIILIIPIVIVLSNLMTASIADSAKRIQDGLGEANIIVQDTYKGIEIVKSYNLGKRFIEKYVNIINKCVKNGIDIDKRVLYIDSVLTVLQLLPYTIFALYGGYLLVNKAITVGVLIAFLTLFDKLYMALCDIPYILADLKTDTPSINRLIDVLSLPIEYENKNHINNLIYIHNPVISFKNVTFSYNKKKNVLKDINFVLNEGKQIGIVGESGSGKSTIFKLMSLFYNGYDGSIEVYGLDISKWNVKELRNKISVVAQETYLFPCSIEENIRYGRPNAEMEDIIAAAKQTNAHEFVMKLPNEYKTILGENGVNLSGGERQRIAIARAIIKNSPILLLDEATSALDTQSEKQVQIALNNLMKNRTTLVIAHRLSTIRNSDEIWVMKDGQIAERGKYEDLMSTNSLYKQLYFKKSN